MCGRFAAELVSLEWHQLRVHMTIEEYERVLRAFTTGEVYSADAETLKRYLTVIASHSTTNPVAQSRDLVQSTTLNNLILQRHIDSLERRGANTQRLVMLLTVASLLGTGYQSYLAFKAESRAEAKTQVARSSVTPAASPASQPSVQTPKSDTSYRGASAGRLPVTRSLIDHGRDTTTSRSSRISKNP